MQHSSKGPLRLGALLLWFLLVYLFSRHFSDLMSPAALRKTLAEFDDPLRRAFLVTFTTYVFTYCLAGYLVFYYLQGRRPWYVLLLTLAGAALGSMFFRAFAEEVVVKALFGVGNYNPLMSWSRYLRDQLYYLITFLPAGVAFYYYQLGRHSTAARQQSELLRREIELKFLRSQINPHFLFNTLNNVYALVSTGSAQALPALEKLSGLLRYALYEQTPLVPIGQEVGYLRDLIHLECLRVENVVPPTVTLGPFTREWLLPPLLLVPFVENAFKHGQLRAADAPLIVSLTEEGTGLRFRVVNPVRRGVTSQDTAGGIGLVNARKRLSLLYPGRHSLRVSEEDDTFVVCLDIQPLNTPPPLAAHPTATLPQRSLTNA